MKTLVTTPSGFKTTRWSTTLGEMLARDLCPFMPRDVRIESVRGALRASSMMLLLWPKAACRAARGACGATALHLAVQHKVRHVRAWAAASLEGQNLLCFCSVHLHAGPCRRTLPTAAGAQGMHVLAVMHAALHVSPRSVGPIGKTVRVQMWIAVHELLRRGLAPAAQDDAGLTPLDYLVAACQVQATTTPRQRTAVHDDAEQPPVHADPASNEGGAADAHSDQSIAEKARLVRESRLYANTPPARQCVLDEFLSACEG